MLQPSVLLMDEPCSALDPISSAVVEDLIESLRGRYTVVIVTHNLAQARRIANYAAFFWVKDRAGTLVEFDHCKRLFESPATNARRRMSAARAAKRAEPRNRLAPQTAMEHAPFRIEGERSSVVDIVDLR